MFHYQILNNYNLVQYYHFQNILQLFFYKIRSFKSEERFANIQKATISGVYSYEIDL